MSDIKKIRAEMKALYSKVPGFHPVYLLCDCSKLPARFFGAYAEPDCAADELEHLILEGVDASYRFMGIHTTEVTNMFPNIDTLILFYYEKLPETGSEERIAVQGIYACDESVIPDLVELVKQKYSKELQHNVLFQSELKECDPDLKFDRVDYYLKKTKMQA